MNFNQVRANNEIFIDNLLHCFDNPERIISKYLDPLIEDLIQLITNCILFLKKIVIIYIHASVLAYDLGYKLGNKFFKNLKTNTSKSRKLLLGTREIFPYNTNQYYKLSEENYQDKDVQFLQENTQNYNRHQVTGNGFRFIPDSFFENPSFNQLMEHAKSINIEQLNTNNLSTFDENNLSKLISMDLLPLINRAYSCVFHPDKQGGNTELFQAWNNFYEVVKR